jgi:glycosyltransferase involved in cell wall biosynthesis
VNKVVFFSFYFPPDISAGSFRSIALVDSLAKKLKKNDELHIITTYPNRYASFRTEVEDIKMHERVQIHRVKVPKHKNSMFSQVITFSVFAFSAFWISKKIKPDFLIGTSSRLMTGLLTSFSANFLGKKYFIDLRDIFSESISDLIAQKNRPISVIVKLFFTFLEKKILNNASGVNIVSEGFREYFLSAGVNTSEWYFFPNGVDNEFLDLPITNLDNKNKLKTILYAGNIGSGQGLETIIPKMAKNLENEYRFIVIGDGSTIELLNQSIQNEEVQNVELFPPMKRENLIEYYKSADILFLHLNNIPAFNRVLPSKIFEYAAIGKPIIAGLTGYPAMFVKNNINYCFVFKPSDLQGAISCVQSAFTPSQQSVNNFVNQYSRVAIMDQMASSIIEIMESN